MSGAILRIDEVGYRFRLTQIHFPIEESPLSELAGLCHTASVLDQQFDNTTSNIGGSMTGNLSSILTCIAMRCMEEGDENFINEFILFVDDVDKQTRLSCNLILT